MLFLIRKDLGETRWFLLFIGAMYVFCISLFHSIVPENMRFLFILFRIVLFIPFLGIGEMTIVEAKEDRFHGYAFLFKLPLTSLSIVGAKVFTCTFVLSVFVFVSWIVDFVLYRNLAFFIRVNSLYVILFGFTLVLQLCMYWGIYRFGYLPFMKVFWTSALGITVLVQFLIFLVSNRLGNIVDTVSLFLEKTGWRLFFLTVVGIVFFCLFLLVLQTKRLHKA
jgi:hypothetical protein